MKRKSLRIGYLWQYEGDGILWQDYGSRECMISATALHIGAVVGGFKRHGHRVRIVALRRNQPHWSKDLVHWQPTNHGVRTHRSFRILEKVLRGIQSRLHLPFLRLFDSYHFSDGCVSALNGFDILYERFFFLNYGGLITARRLGIPLVLEVNGDLYEEFIQQGVPVSKIQWAVIHWVTRFMFDRADYVVAVSETLKQRIVKRWQVDPSKISVVNNGVDIELFDNLDVYEDVRSKYCLGDEQLIIFVGGFKPWHGIILLLEAFSIIAQTSTVKAKLVLVGDGPMRLDCENKINELNIGERVIITGIVPHTDAAAFMSIADVNVLSHPNSPSAVAGSPMKLFEYMAAGRAIVAPELPNLVSLLNHGENALLVPPNNAVALAGALVELLENNTLRATLGKAAKQCAIEKHSWDQVVSELESILYDLLEKP